MSTDSDGPRSKWIYLCTPFHTGTHFVRFMLELHPDVSYWRCGTTEVRGKSMRQWHQLCRAGQISFQDLLELGIECPDDLPAWTIEEADRLEISIPNKTVKRHLVHDHLEMEKFWYPELRTVVTVRDPLLSVIGTLRRGGVGSADAIISGFQFLAGMEMESCFWFCTDLWSRDRDRGLELLNYLDLRPTEEIRSFVSRWPTLNSTSDGRFKATDDPQLVKARTLAATKSRLDPLLYPWAEKLRRAGIQTFMERLGYRDLVWFE